MAIPTDGILRLDYDPDISVYNDDYLIRYEGYSKTDLGRQLTSFRLKLIRDYSYSGGVWDIGPGNGSLIQACIDAGINACAFDVNPIMVERLHEQGLWWDPKDGWPEDTGAITFFDSLEHLSDPSAILDLVPWYASVIVSIPIYSGDWANLKTWKHFRENEHVHCFSRSGFVDFMRVAGFEVVYESDEETRLGRSDIFSFVFQRRNPHD